MDARPGGQQLAEAVPHRDRGAQAADDHDRVQHQHAGQADQPELLADRGDDEVGRRRGHRAGLTVAQTGAEDPAGGEAEQRLHHLVAGAVGIGERVQPGLHADLDVAEKVIRRNASRGEQRQADDHPAEPFGRHVDQHQERRVEQQRGAEVLLEDHHADRDDPRRQQRRQVAGAGQVHAEDVLTGAGEHAALGHQHRGEEDQQQDLGELGGLNREAGQLNPDLRAVLLRDRPRQHGGDRQQYQARRARRRSRSGPGSDGRAGRSPPTRTPTTPTRVHSICWLALGPRSPPAVASPAARSRR